jgi:hypothetical protein
VQPQSIHCLLTIGLLPKADQIVKTHRDIIVLRPFLIEAYYVCCG